MYENEIVTLLLGMGTLFFVANNWGKLSQLPAFARLITGFGLLFVGWIFTILEGYFWPVFLNTAEHICYAASSVFVLLWCWKIFVRGEIK